MHEKKRIHIDGDMHPSFLKVLYDTYQHSSFILCLGGSFYADSQWHIHTDHLTLVTGTHYLRPPCIPKASFKMEPKNMFTQPLPPNIVSQGSSWGSAESGKRCVHAFIHACKRTCTHAYIYACIFEHIHAHRTY